MNAGEYWKLFMQTGSPECYMLFREAKRSEEQDVSESSGSGAPTNGVQ